MYLLITNTLPPLLSNTIHSISSAPFDLLPSCSYFPTTILSPGFKLSNSATCSSPYFSTAFFLCIFAIPKEAPLTTRSITIAIITTLMKIFAVFVAILFLDFFFYNFLYISSFLAFSIAFFLICSRNS